MNAGTPRPGRVFVFGSANHDHVLAVETFPRSGETVLASRYTTGLGGKGANQAVAAASAGADVLFIGGVGDDSQGSDVLANLADHHIDTRFTERLAEPTGVAMVLVDAAGANEIVVAAGANATLAEATVERGIAAIDSSDVVVVQCEISPARVAQIVRGASRRGAFVIVNLAPYTRIDAGLFRHVSLLIVNESEAAALVGHDAAVAERAGAVLAVTGAPCIVTLGECGSVHASLDGARAHVPAERVTKVVDTTGAGDVYVGTIAAGVLRDGDVVAAMRDASVAAARAVAKHGAQSDFSPEPTEVAG